MSDTAITYRCGAWEAPAPAAVEVAFGLLTAQPPTLALDGSLAQVRLLPAPRPLHPLDAALRAVLDRARLNYLGGFPVLAARPGVLGQPSPPLVRAVADGVGCEDSAALIEGTRLGEVISVGPLKTGLRR
jgi:hypothetical protein